MTRPERLWIVRLWRPFLGWMVLILALTFCATIARVGMPIALKRAFDGLAAGMSESGLLAAVLLYLGLGTLEWALATALVFIRGSMNLRFESAAREQAFASLVRQSPRFFQRFRTGDLVTRLTDDVSEKLSWFICSGIFRALAALGTAVFALVMMARLDPLLTALTIGPLPLLVALFIRTGTTLDRRYEVVQGRISDLNGAIEASFSGIRVVKAYGRESVEEKTFDRFASACRSAEVEAAKSQTVMESLYGHVWQLGVVIVLLAGGAGVMSGRLTLGTFVAFDAYVLMLIFPMLDIGTFFVRGRQSGVSIRRLRELEETAPEIAERPGTRAPERPIEGRLSLQDVGYAYTKGQDAGLALESVSFELVPGGIVAVVGKVGSGKSTLLRLVPRIVDPTSGRILLDGVDLRELPLASVRAAVGYVPQEALLFSGTIRENIRFAREWIREEDVLDAVEVARLGKDIAGFPAGLETRVGVRGLTLSGGQKQRVALARALAGRPRILVLDDVTAALDAETETALWEGLRAALPHLATFVVTHRTATLERADRIIVLDRGRLVEDGRHAELSERGRVYRSIYRRHALEERVGEKAVDVNALRSPSAAESGPGPGSLGDALPDRGLLDA